MLRFDSPQGPVDFSQCSMEGPWIDAPGVYVFANWPDMTAYVGGCASLKKALAAHPEWTRAVAEGSTRVYATRMPDDDQRDAFVRWLRMQLQPSLQ